MKSGQILEYWPIWDGLSTDLLKMIRSRAATEKRIAV
jgi:hypothetical protein